jgi:hypothetical protein
MRHGATFGLVAAFMLVHGFTSALAQPPDGPPPEHRDPLRAALDANRDHELDADEIKAAPAAIARLDADGDGRIDRHEFRPPRPPGGADRGPGSGARGERPRGGPGEDGRPPREGRRESGGPADGERPGPGRFVSRAMSCDADGDGKLDRAELETLASEMMQRRQGDGGGERGPGRGPPRDGERPRRAD